MTRLRGLIVSAGVTLGLATGMALAVPPVLEKSPKDAMFVVAVPNPGKFEKSFQSLTTAAEFPFPLPGLEDVLAMGGIGGGLDLQKAFAFAVMPPAEGAAADASEMDGRTIMMLPIADYAAFLENFSAKPGEAGSIDTVNVNGKDQFARNLGDGYAIMSPTKDLIQNFKAGNPTVKADIGKLGERIADTADIVVLVNMEVARPFIKEGTKAAQERMADQMSMMGMDGNEGGDNALTTWISESLVADSKAIVGGIKAGGLGASFEMAANFKEGSSMAAAFQAAGNAGSLLSKLPSMQKYLFAAAIDTSSPGVKKVLGEIAAKAKNGASMPQLFDTTMADADGQAAVVGMNPTMLMGGGVFMNTVTYTSTKEPAKVVGAIKSGLEAMNGKSLEGMTFETSFKDSAAKVGEKSVHVWQVKMQADDGTGMGSQAAAVMFGQQGGPGGYLAEVDGGVIRTFAKNSPLMASAFKSASGGDNLNSDALIRQVGGQLPSGRIGEAYIGVRHIVDVVLPLGAMFGIQLDPESIPAQLPPLGLAVAGEGGSAHFSCFIPAPVIKTGWVIFDSLMPQLEGMGGLGEMGDEPAADEPTGQPRF